MSDIATLLDLLLGVIKLAIAWFLTWMEEIAIDTIIPALAELGEFIGVDWRLHIVSACILVEQICSWVPLPEAMAMYLSFLSIRIILNALKWILKAIPGIWG